MHVVCPVQPSTLLQATRLLERIANLGGVSQYPCLLVSFGELDLAPLHKLAASAFQGVSVFPVEMPHDHPRPDNVLFQRTAQHMGMQVGDAYLYLEPDSWPTSPHWFKDLVSAYREHNARFLGKLAMLRDGSGEHYMMTTGFYPKDFYLKSDLIRQIPLNKSAAEFLQGEIVYRGKAHDSGLFALAGEDHRNAALVLGVKHEALHEMFASIPDDKYFATDKTQSADNVVSAFESEMHKAFPDGEPVASGPHPRLIEDSDVVVPVTSEAAQLAAHLIPTAESYDPSKGFSEPVITYKREMSFAAQQENGRNFVGSDVVLETLQRAADAKLSSEVVRPDESWVNDPRALDPNVEVPTPVAAAVIPEGLPDSGRLPLFPQAVEPVLTFATEEERNAAIKKSQAEGMGWKALLSTYKLSPVAMKKILNAVG